MTTTTEDLRGGEWVTGDAAAGDVLTPERLSDEHRLMGRMATDFIGNEVLPVLDDLEQKNWTLVRSLMRRAAELGLLGVGVPEALGGVALDMAASVVVGEAVGTCASFATTFGGQTGLTTVPLLCFGTGAQQQRYLPRIVSGEWLGAYCLSESGAGSDALSARARATKQPDGSWRLSGEKLWITNGGFADIFIVFAKVDGEQFSAFIVERGFPGVSSGKEEHKMGLHGSSTTPVVLADAQVPAENLLGEAGRGHKIAFNVLNHGRLKLAAMCTGGAKRVIGEAARYAVNRSQFGQPIAAFGAIQHKLAEMIIRTFAVEAALFRTTGLLDAHLGPSEHDGPALAAALEEFAIEASILKVAGSEMIDYVVDENVQIHGGNGFVRDYPAERHYRDARVNRIFEGTNEINRLLIPGMLAKRAMKGDLPIVAAARALQESLLSPPAPPPTGGPLAQARGVVTSLKHAGLMLLGLTMQTYGEKMTEEQEVLMLVADVLSDTFIAESALLRAEQAALESRALASIQEDAAVVFAFDAAARAEAGARTALARMSSGDTLRTYGAALRRVLRIQPADTIAARRRIARDVTERQRYPFDYC